MAKALGGTAVAEVPAGGIHTAFGAVAADAPNSVALSWDDGELSYRELDAAADRLAAHLVRRGVGPETPVAIRLRRGPEYVVAMLAVLKAGGLIVPLEPGMPAERVNEILGKPEASIVIDDALVAAAAAQPAADFRPAEVLPGQAAYVVFTSGTTGEPKGVIGTHHALRAYADDHLRSILRPAARGGSGARCASRTRGRSRSTRPGSRWSRCSTATSCTSSTNAPRPTPRHWSTRSPSTAST